MIRGMRIEGKDLEWTSIKEGRQQAHHGVLLSGQDDFFELISESLQSLNSGEITPELPGEYLYLDTGGVEALGLNKTLGFVVFRKREAKETTIFLFPAESPVEFACSQNPKFLITGGLIHQAFKMFKLDDSNIEDFMSGQIKLNGGKWLVVNVYDKAGWGLEKYKERLRLLNCPVA